MDSQKIIEELDLLPHPEGGYFKEVYRSDLEVYSEKAGAKRSGVTDIYFMLLHGQRSRFHRVVHDEIWHFYHGAPLRLIDYNEVEVNEVRLGDYQHSLISKYTIRGGRWQAAESTGDYSLVGCTVAPGFDFADFTFLSDMSTEAAALQQEYPEYSVYL